MYFGSQLTDSCFNLPIYTINKLNNDIAIKKILLLTKEVKSMVVAELKALHMFKHENIINIIDFTYRSNKHTKVCYILLLL